MHLLFSFEIVFDAMRPDDSLNSKLVDHQPSEIRQAYNCKCLAIINSGINTGHSLVFAGEKNWKAFVVGIDWPYLTIWLPMAKLRRLCTKSPKYHRRSRWMLHTRPTKAGFQM